MCASICGPQVAQQAGIGPSGRVLAWPDGADHGVHVDQAAVLVLDDLAERQPQVLPRQTTAGLSISVPRPLRGAQQKDQRQDLNRLACERYL